jgi:hypothetical protein
MPANAYNEQVPAAQAQTKICAKKDRSRRLTNWRVAEVCATSCRTTDVSGRLILTLVAINRVLRYARPI